MRRVLIANRGAIAQRVLRACEQLGLESVCVYSAADQRAPYLEAADLALPLRGLRAEDSYLDQSQLLNALAESGADAVHPGYGFLAESSAFAHAVAAAGARFVGPSAALIESLGDKVRARQVLGHEGLPLHPASGPLADAAAAEAAWDELGGPLLLKPIGGGGGIGMVAIDDRAALLGAFERAARLADAAFGDPRLFLERRVAGARHIELQLLGDQHGNLSVLHERDCSLQRRQQKLLEQSPAPAVPRDVIDDLSAKAEAAFRSLGYDSVGTLETLWHPQHGFGVLEVNTRIQVEHGVTEAVTGVDLVALQLQVAAGESLSILLPEVPPLSGHAIEARLYAEDWRRGHSATGQLRVFDLPRMRHLRIETGYGVGQPVTAHYDPLLAKLIAWAPDRALALGRLAVGLKALRVEGVATNRDLLLKLLARPEVQAGTVTTDRSVHELIQEKQ